MKTETHWTKTATGYALGADKLDKVGSNWVLTTSGVAHMLGKRASFDHAERIIAAEESR